MINNERMKPIRWLNALSWLYPHKEWLQCPVSNIRSPNVVYVLNDDSNLKLQIEMEHVQN